MSVDEKHIKYFDILRGIAIIFVIINHSYSGNPLAGTLKEDLYLLIRQLVIPAVPIFLALSGYFLARKQLYNLRDYYGFVFSHSFRIWLPMVIWSIPLLLMSNHHYYFLTILNLLIGGYSIYYFITLIIQYYIMQPVLRNVNLGGVIVSFIVTCVSTSFVCYLTAIQGKQLPLIVAVGFFPVWLVYPILGYYIRKKGGKYLLWPWYVVTIMGLMACYVETKILYSPYSGGIGATKLSAIVYSCGIIMVLFNDKTRYYFERYSQTLLFKVLVYIGEVSFGIYLIHKYFLDFFIEKIVDDTFIRSFLTLVITLIFISIVKFIMPTFANKCLGIK